MNDSTFTSIDIAFEIAAVLGTLTPAQAGAAMTLAGVIHLLKQDPELVAMAEANDADRFAEGCKSPAFQQKLAAALLRVRAEAVAA